VSSQTPTDVLALMAEARRPVCGQVRRRTLGAACEVAVLALMDALEDPQRHGATADAVRALLAGAGPVQLEVLLEPLAATVAHGVLEGLTRAGLVEPPVAQVAHLRLDLRPSPERGARYWGLTLQAAGRRYQRPRPWPQERYLP
jgi:hypothetical protein